MRIRLVTQLDDMGRGWLRLDGQQGRPKVPDGDLLAVVPQGSHPVRDKGYWPLPETGVNSDAGHTVITVEGGVPGGSATLFLTVPDAA